jgi:hypothetical protein
MTSLQDPASQGKPKLGETNGDREYLMQVLRAATARAKLISNTLDSIVRSASAKSHQCRRCNAVGAR